MGQQPVRARRCRTISAAGGTKKQKRRIYEIVSFEKSENVIRVDFAGELDTHRERCGFSRSGEAQPRAHETAPRPVKIPIDTKKMNYQIPEANQPLMKLLEMQSLLDPSFRAVLQKRGLNDEKGLYAAISAALII
jgi:hypothetical protein